jgi:cell division protein FtsQ
VPVAGFDADGFERRRADRPAVPDHVDRRQPADVPGYGPSSDPHVTVRPLAAPFARPRKRKPAGKRLAGPLAVAGLTGALSFGVLTGFGDTTRKPSSFMGELDRIAEALGFGLAQVQVSGHKFTTDAAILETLDLGHVRSLVSFNAIAARERIEKLPWIETATVTRLLPDGLAISVTERKPFAVWQLGERETLIDATGRRLGGIRTGAAPDLPRIAGASAPDASAELFAWLARYPDIAARLVLAERVGQRRWTLRLSGDLDILLPARLDVRPFEMLMQGASGRRLLDAGAGQLDLRHPGRIVAGPALRAAGSATTTSATTSAATPPSAIKTVAR